MDAELREAERAGNLDKVRLLRVRAGDWCPTCFNPLTTTVGQADLNAECRILDDCSPDSHRCYVGYEFARTVKRGTVFFHPVELNADGTAARCRVNGMCKLRGPKNDKWWRLPTKIGFRDHDYIQGSLPNDRHFPWISDVWLVNEPMRVLTRTGRISSQPMRVPPSETSSSG